MEPSCHSFSDGGSFSLMYRGLDTPFKEETTVDIHHTDTAAMVKAKLEALPSIREVTVVTTNDGPVCSTGTSGTTSTVTFVRDFGNLPLMRPVTSKLTYYGLNDRGECPSPVETPTHRCAPCDSPTVTDRWCALYARGKTEPWVRTLEVTAGTKEYVQCSGRGICDPEVR